MRFFGLNLRRLLSRWKEGRGGRGGLNFLLPVLSFTASSHPFLDGSDSLLCDFFVKSNTMLQLFSFFLFLPVPTTLGIPLLALSSPTSCRLPKVLMYSHFPTHCLYPRAWEKLRVLRRALNTLSFSGFPPHTSRNRHFKKKSLSS